LHAAVVVVERHRAETHESGDQPRSGASSIERAPPETSVENSRNDVARVIDRQEIAAGDLGFHRLVRESVRDAKEDGANEPAQRGTVVSSWIGILANFELHLRKMFWVDEGSRGCSARPACSLFHPKFAHDLARL
jgi:hypothetical protein